MALDKSKIHGYALRLLSSRMRILADHGFYGMLLSHLTFNMDESLQTAATDGNKLYFSPDFLESISDSELDFVLMHEVLHVVLQHCMRYSDRNPDAFNIACDIVVNSNILKSCGGNVSKISVRSIGGELMHTAPDGKEGYLYTAEQVYEMLPRELKESKNGGQNINETDKSGSESSGQGSYGTGKNAKTGAGVDKYRKFQFDDHTRWEASEDIDNELCDKWAKHLEDAIRVITVTDPQNACGSLPAFAERLLTERSEAQTNWREVLCNFIQEEINDYSFTPPDKRFSEYDFFLPDLNACDETVKNLLFMIDTSGSMSDEMVTQAFDEVRGALTQFNGRLEGYLGFFDACVIEPKPFSSIEELEIIRPKGGGGTSFFAVFDYIREMEEPPCSIIILTDGYAAIPPESAAMDIPVLWVINNENVTPEWGKTVRIK